MFQEKVFGPNPVGYIETCGHSFSVANSAWKLLVWWIGELEVCFDGWEQCWTQPSCFLSRKTKQPNHRKIDPQLVTGTTCTPPSPTYPHLATWFRSGLEMCSPRPVCHQVTENFLPEGPVTIGITSGAWLGSGWRVSHQWRSAWVMTLVGWKKDFNKLQRMKP